MCVQQGQQWARVGAEGAEARDDKVLDAAPVAGELGAASFEVICGQTCGHLRVAVAVCHLISVACGTPFWVLARYYKWDPTFCERGDVSLTSFDVRTANLRAINSLTKYPSIPTYHALDPTNGSLTDEAITFTGPVFLTEKVDGTNGRIVSLPDGTYLIGSREHLLYAQGDLIGDPALGIVDALKPIAERLPAPIGDRIVVRFFEVYGGKVSAASKHYTSAKQVSARLFDIAVIADYSKMMEWPSERIASWRDSGGQRYLGEYELIESAAIHNLDTVPRLDKIDGDGLPTSIVNMRNLLSDYLPHTMVALDGEPGGAEGIVLRDDQRRVIAKARFQDYDRTLKRRKG